jgi:bifunctional DNA-binding transcriptional regulator/antitoxin component of YhaV-PrlF toxin-antitoxin module
MVQEEEQSKRVSLAVNNNGRVTIPAKLRDYFELPDTDDHDVYIVAEIKGLDPAKHPDHEMRADSGGDIL